MRLIILFGLAAMLAIIVSGNPVFAASYTIEKWESDYYRVPCRAWAKNNDGSWSMTGSLYLASGGEVTGKTFVSGREWATIDRRCGANH